MSKQMVFVTMSQRLESPEPIAALSQQVADELKNHPGVIALVDDDAGAVALFMAPVNPYERRKRGP